ncbi:MAG: Txe/YoeB family addiction module toxin [Epsilonproteobacteria bacterium]|nr:Txe/YoeB family addiction module toxin [Campylobacterota bacterium]
MIISFVEESWEDYNYWLVNDKKTAKKIKNLIKAILRNPYEGEGKPEPLKHNLTGYWSRRITKEHRLVYKIEKNQLIIISCRYHYDKGVK